MIKSVQADGFHQVWHLSVRRLKAGRRAREPCRQSEALWLGHFVCSLFIYFYFRTASGIRFLLDA